MSKPKNKGGENPGCMGGERQGCMVAPKKSSTYSLFSDANQFNVSLTYVQKSILKLISHKANIYEISRELNIARSTVRYHLKRLSVLNLISRDGKFGVWKITNMGLQVFQGGERQGCMVVDEVALNVNQDCPRIDRIIRGRYSLSDDIACIPALGIHAIYHLR